MLRVIEQIDSYATIKKDTVAYCNHSPIYGKQELTYGQLKDFSDTLAFYLQSVLGDNKAPLVVYGHKNPYMLVCFLACVKSGRVYCPVDISVPMERIKNIIDETNTPFVLSTEPLEIEGHRIINLKEMKLIAEGNPHTVDASWFLSGEDVYYIIFTSGSTGKPKGVQITENCLHHFLQWAITLGNKNLKEKQCIFLNQAPFSFDLSVMDLYMSLYLGGTLWSLEKSVQTDSNELLESLRRSQVNVWVSTPSFANLCLANQVFDDSLMPQMELFLFCGETLTNYTAKNLQRRFPKATIVNTYGPTESTVAVTSVVVTEEICSRCHPLPVGKPKIGTFLSIVDPDGNLLPEKETGEILITGDSVSVGYYNQPDLTAKSFSTRKVNGEIYRSYRTGDAGYLWDGQLYYCGRMDLQVKLHGYRIEIEDIENNLLKVPGIKNAVVVPNIKGGMADSLSAFVVADYQVENKLREAQSIRKQLSQFLPLYMIPKKFVFTDSIPMTNNGKADRKKLMGVM